MVESILIKSTTLFYKYNNATCQESISIQDPNLNRLVEVENHWCPPPMGSIKINVDGETGSSNALVAIMIPSLEVNQKIFKSF